MTLPEVPGFKKDETETQRELLLSAYLDDPVLFCRQVLSHWFPKPMPWVHRGLLAILTRQTDFLLNFGEEHWSEGECRWTKKKLAKIIRHFTYPLKADDPQSPRLPIFKVHYKADGRTPDRIDIVIGRFTNIIMPRESAKTTVTNAAVLYLILYQLVAYFVYISNTETFANDQLASIKRELESNDHIHAVWGNIVPDKNAAEMWRENKIETTTGVLGATKGRGSQIRGMNRFATRPDLIIMDDIEDEDSVATEEQLAKTQKWYMKAVEPALSKVKGEGRLINLGTIQHAKDISQTHAKDERFTTITFGAMVKEEGENGEVIDEPIWPLYMNKAKYEALKLSYSKRGMLYEFGLEYASTINEEDKAKFKAKNVQRYKLLTPEEFVRDFPIRAIAHDPAISEKSTACPAAFAVIGMNDYGMFHVFDFYMQVGMTVREMVDKFFEMSKAGHCNRHGFEAVAYQAAFGHLLREEMFRKQQYFEPNELYPGNKKRKYQRIEGILQPRIAPKLFTFNERWADLEIQFLHWPHAGYDGPDVMAMAVALCDPYAGLALPKEIDEKTGEELPPAIMRDVTMEDLDYDCWETGVP
jgi:hypothetical protein